MRKQDELIRGIAKAPTVITRSKTALLSAAGAKGFPGQVHTKQVDHRFTKGVQKRAAGPENGDLFPGGVILNPKRRAVLKDISNVSSRNCTSNAAANNVQSKSGRIKPISSKMQTSVSKKDSAIKDTVLREDSRNTSIKGVLADDVSVLPEKLDSEKSCGNLFKQQKVEKQDTENSCESSCQVIGAPLDFSSSELHGPRGDCKIVEKSLYVDIDSDIGNPQMCCCYASEIYTNLRASELLQRPRTDFMEALQHDINQSMRAILVDWLVEVAEEYQLVPDTLYLTVYVIDSYLSHNYVERHRLQLLGITAMLIASKYEEICAPSIEKFCFITDNTYSREDVLRMEVQVLKCLSYRLSVPTAKTFLRRFLRAAQASKVPSLLLEFLANYFTELTLLEYGFLKFLPSVVAASAIFLARWTLDPSINPWDSTLEHYTSYKALDLKSTVIAIQELQMNAKNCTLDAIKEKYKQLKFKYVANLPHQVLLPTLFP